MIDGKYLIFKTSGLTGNTATVLYDKQTIDVENGVLIAPMSLYKILEEIKEITRFQLIQKSYKKLELRLISNKKYSV